MVKGVFKTARNAVGHRLVGQVPDGHPVLTWLVRHAPCPHNRYTPRGIGGADAVGPRRRKAIRDGCGGIWEIVMLLSEGTRKDKYWSFGAWLGPVTRTHGAYIGSLEGIVRGWAVKRIG